MLLLLRRGRCASSGRCEVTAHCAFGAAQNPQDAKRQGVQFSGAWPTATTATTERTPLRSLLRFVFL
eukprot:6067296-Prymnesium_polylepis.1